MNKIEEDRSLLEVRDWKVQCRLEDQHLSTREYLEKLRAISEKMKVHYHIHLDKICLFPANQA